jgi:hypothetical protein
MPGKTGKCEAGKLYACKKCGKMPNIGDIRYYEKIGENWIGCIDLECFKAQGGTYDPNAQQGGKFSSNKFPLSDAIKVYNLATELTNLYKNLHKDITPEIEAQFMESIFKSLSGNFKP